MVLSSDLFYLLRSSTYFYLHSKLKLFTKDLVYVYVIVDNITRSEKYSIILVSLSLSSKNFKGRQKFNVLVKFSPLSGCLR